MTRTLTLVSHALCPYVQRAAIALAEKKVAFRRVDIDLARKPDWFLVLSPLGKVPVLRVETGTESRALFESQVIVEYLEETEPRPLHPADPLARAQHRAWIEMASATLARIAGFYSAQTDEALAAEARALTGLFRRWETTLGTGPWFGGEGFSLVDAAAAPIFRYLDAFEAIGAFRVLDGCPKVEAWRRELAGRPSVAGAVSPDYPVLLRDFLRRRDSALSRRMPDRTAVASPA